MVQPGKQPAPKVPLNNLGKVIQRRKELNISQETIGHIVGLGSRQAWNNIERKYDKSIKEYPNDGIYDYPFTAKQMIELNQILGFSAEDALAGQNDPMVFDERAILEAFFNDATDRDSILVTDALACICEAREEDLPILRQTVDVLIDRISAYKYEQSLLLLSAIRNSVSEGIRTLIPDDEALKHLYEECLQRARKEAEQKEEERIRKKYRDECRVLCEKEQIDNNQIEQEAERRYQEGILEVLKEGRYRSQKHFNNYLERALVKIFSDIVRDRVSTQIESKVRMFLNKYGS